MVRKLEFFKGQKFGEWTYLGEESHLGKERVFKCRCSCGREKWVLRSSLSKGKSKSCGCLQVKHGITKSKFHIIFTNMKQRCYNPLHKSYKDYGAKGIRVERRDFMEFYNDMYESYLDHVAKFGENETTIDRIDGRGNYCKENCKRSTHLEQSNNLSSNRTVEYKGKVYKTLASLCREYGIGTTTLNQRINKYGWTLEEAIETPIQIHKKTLNV